MYDRTTPAGRPLHTRPHVPMANEVHIQQPYRHSFSRFPCMCGACATRRFRCDLWVNRLLAGRLLKIIEDNCFNCPFPMHCVFWSCFMQRIYKHVKCWIWRIIQSWCLNAFIMGYCRMSHCFLVVAVEKWRFANKWTNEKVNFCRLNHLLQWRRVGRR